MLRLNNPVLQRELLVHLRTARAFALLLGYVGALALAVLLTWPGGQRLDLTSNPIEARRLLDLALFGQYLLAALIVPSLAAGALSGERERQTYEMLVSSPLRPSAIVLGKLLAALGYMAVLIVASLPITVLCLPLGGMSVYELLASYAAMAASLAAFGMISITASSFFPRTLAATVVSYLTILPLGMVGILFHRLAADAPRFRMLMLAGVVPVACLGICVGLYLVLRRRLLYPLDAQGAAGRFVSAEAEQADALGMVLDGDDLPDRLLTPSRRKGLIPDGLNPVYDRQMHSELLSQGTLMLRLVVQLSLLLALPLMAICLFLVPHLAFWYVAYVLMFATLVGPVFSAGAISNERERQTLDLLLSTALSSPQILWGKLLANLQVCGVLTALLLWPLLLAWALPPWPFRNDLSLLPAYMLIVAVTVLTTNVLPTFCSAVFQRTSTAALVSYMVLLGLFALPPAVEYFVEQTFAAPPEIIARLALTSPFVAAGSLPLSVGDPQATLGWRPLFDFLAVQAALNALVWLATIVGFELRRRDGR